MLFLKTGAVADVLVLPNFAAAVPITPKVNVLAVWVVSDPKFAKAPEAIERFPPITTGLLSDLVPPDKERLLKFIEDEVPPMVCDVPFRLIVLVPEIKVPPLLVQLPATK